MPPTLDARGRRSPSARHWLYVWQTRLWFSDFSCFWNRSNGTSRTKKHKNTPFYGSFQPLDRQKDNSIFSSIVAHLAVWLTFLCGNNFCNVHGFRFSLLKQKYCRCWQVPKSVFPLPYVTRTQTIPQKMRCSLIFLIKSKWLVLLQWFGSYSRKWDHWLLEALRL